ncbi:hypothetical protein BDV28DRAFT_148202 [Aspergillus coremiiformis]|uniref:Teneurin-like YD-shell domain-containing protein n=1 Tax=Aspergillus coremiiformis TaxID=138285 RepID=A0A5N6Z813_9EURO|nr:hypothetical protein BDV28DRAFT_148202 [Aspergillus coremiiformis]
MASAQNTLYSQGFSFGSFIQRGVDPRTGQYTCTIDVYEVPAQTRNCPPLSLSLSYSPFNAVDVGLGKGWSFNFSSYDHRQSRTLFLSTGENYKATETTSTLNLSDQKLKSFQFRKQNGNYLVIHKSGQIEVLSNANNTYNTSVPVEIYAANGRSLKLVWTRVGEQPRLSKIQDGSEDLLQIVYTDAQVRITRAPNTTEASSFLLQRRNSQLVELQLPLEDREAWKFVYQTVNQLSCLTSVTSPAGLLEEVTYKQIGHRLPKGAPYQSIPYVISYTVRPGNQQPPIKTAYSYSDRNFLAYNGGYDWKNGQDNLYLVPNDYQYSSIVQVEGGLETQYAYNKFHLLVSTQQRQGSKQVTQTITYHALANTEFAAQPAQYQLPKRIETTYRDTASGASRTETIQQTFDEWGNPTQEIQPSGIKTERVYYPTSGEKNAGTGEVLCPADPHGFQRYLKTETVTPATSNFSTPVRSKRYTYQAFPTVAGAWTDYFTTARQQQSLEEDRSLSSTEYTYVDKPAARDHSRLQQQTTRLNGQYQTTYDWTYQYPSSERFTETTRTKTFDGITVQDETESSLLSGLMLGQKDQAGTESRFQYNTIGQLVRKTVSPGTAYEATEYYKSAVREGAVGYDSTVTDTKGVQTRYITDGLERILRVEQQDDDGAWSVNGAYQGTFRVIQEHNYNAHGQRSETVDIDWLRTGGQPKQQRSQVSFEYDGWGQVCKVTRSSGLVTLSLTDPIALTHTEGIQGEGQTRTKLSLFSTPLQKALLKADGTLYSKIDFAYDGVGRLVQETDNSGLRTQYQYDTFNRIVQTIRPDGKTTRTEYAAQSAAVLPTSIEIQDRRLGEQSFDSLDRLIRTAVGGRTTVRSYEKNSPVPSQITTPRGDHYSLSHQPALDYALTKVTRTDDADAFQYDTRTADVLQAANSFSRQDLTYFPSGLLSRESTQISNTPVLSATATYSMAGKLQRYTDVHGEQREIDYDAFGRPQQLVQGKVRVTFRYDQSDRLSWSIVEDEAKNSSLATRLEHDEFGREIKRTVLQDGTTLYQYSQSYDKTGLVSARDLKDGQGNISRQESFQYDSLHRLTDYQGKGGQRVPTDEQGRQIQSQHFQFDVYDNLTQVSTVFQDRSENIVRYSFSEKDPTQVIRLTNSHPDYPSQVDLAYDENGCLIKDEQGRILEYDPMNRLIAVRDAKNQILSEYRYDAAGRLVCQKVPAKPDTYLHYYEDTLIAVTKGDSRISYLSDGNMYWGQIARQGSSTQTQLWASDNHQSVLSWLDTQHADDIHHEAYTPYGFSMASSSIGFNGQWRDPVTGWYHLGNGNRVYNPVLLRFHAPDSWSPFTSGDINPYVYCAGDPINRLDPSGHFSIFGIKFGSRDFVLALIGIGVGILAGVLTAGAGFAIEAGVAIAAGIASDVVSGAVYDLASGKAPTWQSVGTDALYGAIGGIVGEGVTKGISTGAKAVARGVKGLSETVDQLLKGAEKLRVAGGKRTLPGFEDRIGGLAHLNKQIQGLERNAPKLTVPEQKILKGLKASKEVIERRPSWRWNDTAVRDQFRRNQTRTVGGEHIKKYYKLRDLVSQQGLDPREAARLIGDAHFEQLTGRLEGQYTVRLSQQHRVAFQIDWEERAVEVFRIGGHYP